MLKYWLQGALKSWTIWFNGICGALMALLPLVQEYLPYLQQALTPGVYRFLLIGFVVGNILLRFKTNSALIDK